MALKYEKNFNGVKLMSFNELDEWIDNNAPNLNKSVLHTQIASEIPEPTGTKSITTNGDNIDVKNYASVNVNVPASAVVSGTKNITANGTSDVTNYASVRVNVSGSADLKGSCTIINNYGAGLSIGYFGTSGVWVEAYIENNASKTIPCPYRVNDGVNEMYCVFETYGRENLVFTGSTTYGLVVMQKNTLFMVHYNPSSLSGTITITLGTSAT